MHFVVLDVLAVISVPVLVLVLGRVGLERSRLARLGKTPVLIGAAMNAYGITPADAEAAGLDAEIQDAIRRCMACICAEEERGKGIERTYRELVGRES